MQDGGRSRGRLWAPIEGGGSRGRAAARALGGLREEGWSYVKRCKLPSVRRHSEATVSSNNKPKVTAISALICAVVFALHKWGGGNGAVQWRCIDDVKGEAQK